MRFVIALVALACGPSPQPTTPGPVPGTPTGATGMPAMPTGSTASTADTGAPVVGSDCPDVATYAWSAAESLREADLLWAYRGAAGLDGQGRGWF
ncbi:MAG: hypothetical protein AAF211_30935, partial [Myxococcota bacterium]